MRGPVAAARCGARLGEPVQYAAPMPSTDPYVLAETAASEIVERTGGRAPRVAIVLGSGWLPAADTLGPADVEVSTAELTGFPVPTVAGHFGSVRALDVGEARVLVLVGRVHLYEGRTEAEVVHGGRAAGLAGCTTLVLTHAAGAV